MVIETVLVELATQVAKFTMGNGEMITKTDGVNKFTEVAMFMMENGKMVKETELERKYFRMVLMKEISRTIKNTEAENLHIKVDL